nr:hypothetical protein [Oceanococcus sp. HetDA_MAG_MS8]
MVTFRSLIVFAGCALVSCASWQDFAARPSDWGAYPTQTWSVEGVGDWARLRRRDMTVGPFSTADLDYSLWATAPTQTRQTVGDEEDGVYLGTAQVGNTSNFAFTLMEGGVALARIRCRQRHHQQSDVLGYADDDERTELQELGAFFADLHCVAQPQTPSWAAWELSMQATPWRPLSGVLQAGSRQVAVIGSTRSSVAELNMTTGYTLRQGQRSLMVVDRLRSQQLEYWPELSAELSPALVAAAMALLLANDPLEAGV